MNLWNVAKAVITKKFLGRVTYIETIKDISIKELNNIPQGLRKARRSQTKM